MEPARSVILMFTGVAMRQQRQGFSALVGLIYEAARSPGLVPDMLAAVSDHVGASGGMVVRNDVRPGRSWTQVGRLDPELSRLYLERHVDNPYTRGIARVPGGAVVSANAVVGFDLIRPTGLYADILAPQGIVDLIVCPYAPWTNDSISGGVSFAIQRGRTDSTGDALRRMRQVAPHLTRALDLASLLAARSPRHPTLCAALDAAPTAALLLDSAGRIVHLNGAAEALLRDADGLAGTGQLVATTADARWRLERLIGQCGASLHSGWPVADRTMLIPRPSGRPAYGLCVIPIPAAPTTLAGPDDPSMLVFIAVPDAPAGPGTAGLLQRMFGLTRAEARVAAAIAQGGGTAAVAAQLGIGTETVKRHLSHCFAKLGVGSQAALARLVGALPARPG